MDLRLTNGNEEPVAKNGAVSPVLRLFFNGAVTNLITFVALCLFWFGLVRVRNGCDTRVRRIVIA
jgi:hypothetical protein